MSNDDSTVGAAETVAETTSELSEQQAPKPTKPTDTVDFWKAKAREQEKRAKANADAAQRLAELEDANKSEQQKLAEAAQQAQADAAQARAEALRYRVATKFGIADEEAELFLTGTDEDTLTRQGEALAELKKSTVKPPAGVYVPQSGHQPAPPALNSDDLEQALRSKLNF